VHLDLAVVVRAAQPALEAPAVLGEQRQDGVLVAAEALDAVRRDARDENDGEPYRRASLRAGAPKQVRMG
jgi:hypothetical protein